MFRKKCIVIVYKKSQITGSIYVTGRFVSYTTLFLRGREYLNELHGEDYAITNVIKL